MKTERINEQNTVEKKSYPFLFYMVLGLMPFLFFIVLEFGLRAISYGTEYKLFHKPEGYVSDMLYVNPEMSYKYFGKLKGTVFFRGIGFAERKPENSFRIFVLGGSSAQGFPYRQNASFPSHLQRRLELLYPNRMIEVINLGASAINSHTLLDILPEVIDQHPDLILIYAGHNEYYGALGPGASNSLGTHPTFVRVLLSLRDFRVVQLMENIVAGFYANKDGTANLMQDMIGESYIPLGSDIYQAGIEQFEENMSAMLRKIKKSRVPVIISTISSNLGDHKPFISRQTDESGRTAIEYFELAKTRVLEGDSLTAKAQFAKARKLDGLRFRAPAEINDVIQDLSAAYQVPIANIDSLFSGNSPMNIVGNNLMSDHLHPNMAGYMLMSKGFYSTIVKNGILPNATNEKLAKEQIDSVLIASLPFTKLDSVQAQYTIVGLLGKYPFVPKGQPNPLLGTLVADDFIGDYGAVTKVDSVRTLIAGEYLRSGDLKSFEREMNVFVSYFPSKEHFYLNTINYLKAKGLLDQAYPVIYEVLKRQKSSASKDKMIGMYHEYTGAYRKAIACYDVAIKARPNDKQLYKHRGYAYMMSEQYELAIQDFSWVISMVNNDADAYHQRGVSKYSLKDYEGTIDDFNEVIRLKGKGYPMSFLIRGHAYFELNKTNLACEDWSRAAQFGLLEGKRLYENHCK